MNGSKDIRVSISPQSIVTILLTVVGLWVLYQIKDIIVLFLVVVALVVAFSPIIKIWQQHMPRGVAILLLYLAMIFGVLLIFMLILPPTIQQLHDFILYLQSVFGGVTDDPVVQQLQNNLSLLASGQSSQIATQLFSQFKGSLSAVYSGALGLFGGLVALITVLIASFYLLLEENSFYNFIRGLLPKSHVKKANEVIDGITVKMSSWLRGQLTLMVVVGALTSIGMAILGVPYALLLGVWAGIMEFLPFVGPVLGAIPGIVLAFATFGLVKGLIAIAIYLLIQQIENQFLVPRIMGKALGLSPVVIIFSLLIGGQLLGFIGLLIAIPVAAALSVIYEVWQDAEE